LFITLSTFAQKKYDAKTSETTVSLEGKTLKGYKTNFDFSREDVRRGWWEYARKFGNPLNMKTYYKVTIPAERTDGNVDLELFTQTTGGTSGSDLFLGLELEKYKPQALGMILEFKKIFYITDLTDEINDQMDLAKDLSSSYKNSINNEERNEILVRLNLVIAKIAELKNQIKEIEKAE